PHPPTGRFRAVQLADGVFALVISKVLSDDGDKHYGCNATNPITRQTVESPVKTVLKVQQPFLEPSGSPYEEAVSPFPPKVVSPPRPTELTVTEGVNVTYTCITESSPIAEVSYLRDEGRLALPTTAVESRDFGILQFADIRQEDQGGYLCRVTYRKDLTASSHLRVEKKFARFNIAVKKRLSIVTKPNDVIVDEPDVEASFECRLQGSSGQSPLWFFNGRLIDARDPASGFVVQETPSDPGASRLIVPRFDPSYRGVVQCVANDRERRIWESAQAVLLMQGESVQSQPLP
uniref:Ig-like domain-containing protein n=1 Tax=Macrostomum lignano TaxID=282301 RepID=A0A1I8HI01_9PLAT